MLAAGGVHVWPAAIWVGPAIEQRVAQRATQAARGVVVLGDVAAALDAPAAQVVAPQPRDVDVAVGSRELVLKPASSGVLGQLVTAPEVDGVVAVAARHHQQSVVQVVDGEAVDILVR